MSRGAVRVPQPVYLLCCKYGVYYNSWPNDIVSFMQFHTSPANFVATSYLCAVFSFCVFFFFLHFAFSLRVCVAKTVVLTQERVDVQQAATREALWFLTRLLTQVLSFKGLYLLISPAPRPSPRPPPHPCLKIALALHMRYLIGLNMNKLCTTIFRDLRAQYSRADTFVFRAFASCHLSTSSECRGCPGVVLRKVFSPFVVLM